VYNAASLMALATQGDVVMAPDRRYLERALIILLLFVPFHSFLEAQKLPGVSRKASLLSSQKKPGKQAAASRAPAPAAQYTGPKKRLGIMDLDVKVMSMTAVQPTMGGGMVQTNSVMIPPPSDFGTGLTEMLTTSLVDTGRFVCLERKAMADIDAEHMLSSGHLADASSAPAKGALLGAQALIRGAVTEYTYTVSSTGGSASFLKKVGVSASKAEAAVTLDIRIYDVETGEILDSVQAEGRSGSTGANVSVDQQDWQMSGSGFSQTPLGRASREAIDRAVQSICERMEKRPWEGRIAEIEAEADGSVALYINAGTKLGLKQGDVLQILRPGRKIVDPETKTVIGRTRDNILGACRIEEALEGVSIAKPLQGEAFVVNDIVRLAGAETAPGN
jgi:curli biogenesis system outer membrane secretion channel CsgG